MTARRAFQRGIAAGASILAPRVAAAHTGSVPGPHDIWTHWGASAPELTVLLLPSAWYAIGLLALWRQAGTGHGVSRGHATAFALGMIALLLALASPLDAAAEALFSAHMIQHMVLILVAAPLCIAGTPIVVWLWALPAPARRRIGSWWASRNRGHAALRTTLHVLMAPVSVFFLHAAALWFWHAPGPYTAALERPATHALEHASFFATACAFWWCVIPATRGARGHGAALLLIGGTLAQSGALGALITLARSPWYTAQAAGARVWGITPLADQQLAGLIMWVPAGVVYVGAAAVVFLRWIAADERRDALAQKEPVRVMPVAAMEGI